MIKKMTMDAEVWHSLKALIIIIFFGLTIQFLDNKTVSLKGLFFDDLSLWVRELRQAKAKEFYEAEKDRILYLLATPIFYAILFKNIFSLAIKIKKSALPFVNISYLVLIGIAASAIDKNVLFYESKLAQIGYDKIASLRKEIYRINGKASDPSSKKDSAIENFNLYKKPKAPETEIKTNEADRFNLAVSRQGLRRLRQCREFTNIFLYSKDTFFSKGCEGDEIILVGVPIELYYSEFDDPGTGVRLTFFDEDGPNDSETIFNLVDKLRPADLGKVIRVSARMHLGSFYSVNLKSTQEVAVSSISVYPFLDVETYGNTWKSAGKYSGDEFLLYNYAIPPKKVGDAIIQFPIVTLYNNSEKVFPDNPGESGRVLDLIEANCVSYAIRRRAYAKASYIKGENLIRRGDGLLIKTPDRRAYSDLTFFVKDSGFISSEPNGEDFINLIKRMCSLAN